MAKAPANTTVAVTDTPSGAAPLADAVKGLTDRVDDLAAIVTGLPDRSALETLSMALTQSLDNNTELTKVNERLNLQVSDLGGDLQRLRQDVAELKSGGVVAHLVGDTGPTLVTGMVDRVRRDVLGVDYDQVNPAEAAEAVGILAEDVFSAKRRDDGRIGVVTVDGRKLIEGQV